MSEEKIVSEVEQSVSKPPRTAIICSRRILTDYSLYLKYLLVGLADESAQICLVIPSKINVESIVPPAFKVLRYPAVELPLMQQYNQRILLHQLTEFGPELLHCLCESMAALARRLSRQLQIPYILNIDSISSPRKTLMISPTRCMFIITPAKSIADYLKSSHPEYADRIKQINIGVFVSEKPVCFAHRDRLAGIVIACTKNFRNVRASSDHLDNVLQVLHRLSIENYKFIAALICDGTVEKYIRPKLSQFGLSREVTLISDLPVIDPAIAAADIFVVPCASPVFNMAMFSAMSAGCAVAACRGGVDDLIIDNQTAVIFNPDDQLSIYSVLKGFLNTPDYARQIAENAQEFLRQNHRVSDMISATLHLYHQTCQRQ